MHQYFRRFRETGQIGESDDLPEFNYRSKVQNSSDSLKLKIAGKGNNDTYFTGILNDPDNLFSGGRLQRVNFGIKIFSERYSTLKKIIGGGFDYLWDFGNEFYFKNNHRFYFDYPHNPILSAFLYSGILGGLSMICFFFMTFLNFIKGFRSLIYFICLYVIIFFFAFFSGNSIFGNPEFVFVSLIPFYFTAVRHKGNQKCTVNLDK
jgi:O-antigen ligase